MTRSASSTRFSPNGTRLGLLMALCASSVVGCGEGESSDGVNGAAGRVERGATCEGEPARWLPESPFNPQLESGDIQLMKHIDDGSVHERSLITAEITPLFEVEEPNYLLARRVVMDERDIFQGSWDGILRYDRVTRELSLFAPHPEPEDPAVSADAPKYYAMAISPTQLAAVLLDRRALNTTTWIYDRYVVAIIDRASGERRFIPVERPIEANVRLYAHGDRFFHVRSIATNSDDLSRHGEIYAYDFETGTPEPFLESRLAFDEYGITFWQDSMLATTFGDGGWNLVRVPISGGEPEVIATALHTPYESFAVSGNEAFALLYQETDETNGGGRLTAIDLTNGKSRAIGTCDAVPFHGSDDYIYLHAGLSTLRMTP
jgi:hypothetical protein